MSVRILTDSTCDLPAEVISRLCITVVPLHIHVGRQDYLDGIDISRENFYESLPKFTTYPTTAVPSLVKFRSLYDALVDTGASEIISIHIASSLSAICNVARAAAEEIHSVPVTVFDSRQLSLGMGFLVQTAAEMAQAGATVQEILPRLEKQITRTHVWATLDTLTYLRRSGRMNGVISSTAELLQIKPILKMYDGVSGVERVRTRSKALKRLLEMLQIHAPFEKLAFLHSAARDKAQALRDEVQELLPGGETWFEVINPVLGTHLGPGVVGVACVSKK